MAPRPGIAFGVAVRAPVLPRGMRRCRDPERISISLAAYTTHLALVVVGASVLSFEFFQANVHGPIR